MLGVILLTEYNAKQSHFFPMSDVFVHFSFLSATTNYTFTYDNFGNTTESKAGDYTLATYTYNSYNGKLSSMTYGNGTTVSYIYDALDRIEI